ncbi:hypothetical protein EST62_03485 [Chlorobaculum sp. 24CR]|jgi:hypothetical protein|uniref:AbiU2 domain-containing protein n=1 Tax=Chlorobaculum sp. 24CR TaxID=2508878 RepID=UPI00100A5F56|nr:hypothetical protein [Chlorobaculum sp. 24CR]RXK88362.1 hypothetical protein EST62_03485 [Chlorobaculum sp. 24CR]
MKEAVSNKIKSQLSKIIEAYFELVRLELDNFRLVLLIDGVKIDNETLVHVTTSGCDDKINKRRKLLGETFYSQKKDITDSFFLTLAKLFDEPKRNQPNSIPVMVSTISKNYHIFEKTEKLKVAISTYEESLIKNIDLINLIKEHRDKCLAHNDNKSQCNHLDSLSTNETRRLMDIIKNLVNSVSSFFDLIGISESDINKMSNESFKKNTELLKTLEK